MKRIIIKEREIMTAVVAAAAVAVGFLAGNKKSLLVNIAQALSIRYERRPSHHHPPTHPDILISEHVRMIVWRLCICVAGLESFCSGQISRE